MALSGERSQQGLVHDEVRASGPRIYSLSDQGPGALLPGDGQFAGSSVWDMKLREQSGKGGLGWGYRLGVRMEMHTRGPTVKGHQREKRREVGWQGALSCEEFPPGAL